MRNSNYFTCNCDASHLSHVNEKIVRVPKNEMKCHMVPGRLVVVWSTN